MEVWVVETGAYEERHVWGVFADTEGWRDRVMARVLAGSGTGTFRYRWEDEAGTWELYRDRQVPAEEWKYVHPDARQFDETGELWQFDSWTGWSCSLVEVE